MSPLNQIQIDGYKCLKSLDVDLNTINIITGRNNTGKTSVLESIDLALNPGHINNYSPNISGLINHESEAARISCSHFDNNYEFELTQPEPSNAISIYADALPDLINRQSSHRYWSVHHRRATVPDEFPEDFNDTLIEKAQEAALHGSQEMRDEVARHVFLVKYNENVYPYIFLSGFHFQVAKNIIDNYSDELAAILMDQIDGAAEEEVHDFAEQQIERTFHYHIHEGFFAQSPPTNGIGRLIRTTTLERDPSDDDDDRAAVKKTEIRDYLDNHNIIDRIQDFDFDEIVVEKEGGERYSLDYEYMGDGFKSFIGILWELIGSGGEEFTNDIIMLEEPENHLHPGYINELVPFLVQFAEENGNQLIITTHNIDFVSGFLSDELSPSEKSFLENHLSVIQMTETIPDIMDYEKSKHELDNLHKDLRGV